MTTPAPALPFARWSLVAAFVLLGATLLVTAWTTYAGVRDASATLLRGQAETLQLSIRFQLAAVEDNPTTADLEQVLREQSASGLRYLGVLKRGGLVDISAGEQLIQGPFNHRGGDSLLQVGTRVRSVFRAQPRWKLRDGRPLVVAMEFEPVEAHALRATAARTFGVGAVAAMVLLVIAVDLFRRVLKREAVERQLEQARRLASLGEMSAVLAHEIRNPLASLKGNAQLLAQMLSADEKHGAKAKRVVDEATRLEKLTHDLLDYVRSGVLNREEVSPGQLLRESAGRVSGEVSIDDAKAPAKWSIDAQRMQQVLVNLLENAVQAGPPVRAFAYEQAGALVFDIQDGGPGVPAEDRERIFEPFFTNRIKGTGLGLAIVKRVVTQHGGTLSVDAAPGGGALFRVVLPSAAGR